jgi:hypothetical protein
MLATMLPKAKASACSNCQLSGVGCTGPYCYYYYNRLVGGLYKCYVNQVRSCGGTFYHNGCC